MKQQLLIYFFAIALCIACGPKKQVPITDDLNTAKQQFIAEIRTSELEEGPNFFINYSLKTKFFSKELQSLFGELLSYEHLPHEWVFNDT